jgi:hypothetical protein
LFGGGGFGKSLFAKILSVLMEIGQNNQQQQPAQPAAGGLFGQTAQQPAQPASGGLFGSTAPKPGGLFGAASTTAPAAGTSTGFSE